HKTNLLVELLLGVYAVVIRHEQKAALEQVFPEPLYFRVREARGSGIFHEGERALKQRIVGQADDDRIRDFSFTSLAFARHRHAHLGQFREPDAQIDVGARVVGAPALLFAPVAREHHTAEVEVAVERRRGGKLGGSTAVEAG